MADNEYAGHITNHWSRYVNPSGTVSDIYDLHGAFGENLVSWVAGQKNVFVFRRFAAALGLPGKGYMDIHDFYVLAAIHGLDIPPLPEVTRGQP